MSLVRINPNPSGRQLAVFAAAWAVFAGVAGAVLRHHGRIAGSEAAWAAAVALPLAGCLSRRVLRLAYLGLSYATFPIGYVVSHVALALVYYLALTPIGLTMRLIRHDPMQRTLDRSAKTYWTRRAESRRPGDYFRQG